MSTVATTEVDIERASHANHSKRLRLKKAEKIAALLGHHCALEGTQLLDVGTGSGDIATAFGEIVGQNGRVISIDRVDERQTKQGFEFIQVEDCRIPLDDHSVDVAITNHVIEHTGWDADQRMHLRELRRVLKPTGVLYFAAPNQWTIMEPHFKLPFLSWLPRFLRSSYVKLAGRGTHYDCFPRSRSTYKKLLNECGFAPTEMTAEAVQIVARNESNSLSSRFAAGCPGGFIRNLPILPTLIFIGRPIDIAS